MWICVTSALALLATTLLLWKGLPLMKKVVKKMKATNKTILNKLAKRPSKVLTTRIVMLYKCREGGLEYQKWVDAENVLMEGDKMTIEFKFEDFEQQDG
jgi:hypothetical protein